MDRNPKNTILRKAMRQLRRGRNASCALCGETAPEALETVSDPAVENFVRGWLEEHHALGRAHDPKLTITLCTTHHRKATEAQQRGDVSMLRQADFLNRLREALKSFASFLELLQEAIERWLKELEEFMGFLDEQAPEWRKDWEGRK